MAWSKTLISVGGDTQGQRIPYQPWIFSGYSVGVNDYTIVQSDNGQDGVDTNISSYSFDVPYNAGEVDNDFKALAKIAVLSTTGTIERYIGIRYKYRSEIAFGVTRLTCETEIGYWDTQGNYTSMGGRACQTYSQSSTLFKFKVRCHICAGTTTGANPYDFFGVAISIQATDRNKFVYAGILDARSYVQGTKESGGEFSPEFGPSATIGGGYNDIPNNPHGTFDDSSDIISIDPKPTLGVTSAGFVNVYKIEMNDLQTLGEKLFPHFLPAELLADPSLMSTPEMLATFLKTIFGTMISPVGTTIELADNLGIIDILMNGKLIDYVLDCHIIPTSISGATVEGLKVGYRQFNDLQLAKATEDYVDVDCGSLSIDEYWGNFLDYSCKVDLYLPFVGYVPLENEYWNSGTISVKYRVNIVDGSFQAYVLSTSGKSKLTTSLIAQYGGVCCVHLPITGLQYSNVVAGLVNGTAASIANGATGNYAGVATSLMNMATLKPDNPASNGYNASSSFLAHRTPYLIIKRPTAQFSTRYNKEMGLPVNVAVPLSSISGFTVIDNPVLNINCSDEEYNEIVSLLKSGVIF